MAFKEALSKKPFFLQYLLQLQIRRLLELGPEENGSIFVVVVPLYVGACAFVCKRWGRSAGIMNVLVKYRNKTKKLRRFIN